MGAEGVTKVLFSCSSVGITHRGIESFFRESFDNLKDAPGMDAMLVKGGGEPRENEKVVWCLAKTSRLACLVGRFTGRSAYAVEQWTSFPGVVRAIRSFRPDVVFYSDSNLGFLLHRFRSLMGVPFRLLFSNGGPCHPPFDRCDFVHQVAPFYLNEAIAAAESPAKHFLVPYGIRVPAPPDMTTDEQRALRGKLGLPLDRRIVLSVGWISRQHKRMDYVIEETARLPSPRPFLLLLGAVDERSDSVVDLGNHLLGPENFDVRSVPYEQVGDFYRAADVFVLGSLVEGFGRVYLEALMHGLPTIGHCHSVMEYVLGNAGVLADLSQPGNLAAVLAEELARQADAGMLESWQRWESVRSRFGWEVLRPQYMEMFRAVADRRAMPRGHLSPLSGASPRPALSSP